ncbi:hypothetical protein CO230_01565 [Chryseobacterium sp. 6424]|nr:hypothetical protein CO230_01565 [Chryseobacterium sp. 6424]
MTKARDKLSGTNWMGQKRVTIAVGMLSEGHGGLERGRKVWRMEDGTTPSKILRIFATPPREGNFFVESVSEWADGWVPLSERPTRHPIHPFKQMMCLAGFLSQRLQLMTPSFLMSCGVLSAARSAGNTGYNQWGFTASSF